MKFRKRNRRGSRQLWITQLKWKTLSKRLNKTTWLCTQKIGKAESKKTKRAKGDMEDQILKKVTGKNLKKENTNVKDQVVVQVGQIVLLDPGKKNPQNNLQFTKNTWRTDLEEFWQKINLGTYVLTTTFTKKNTKHKFRLMKKKEGRDWMNIEETQTGFDKWGKTTMNQWKREKRKKGIRVHMRNLLAEWGQTCSKSIWKENKNGRISMIDFKIIISLYINTC